MAILKEEEASTKENITIKKGVDFSIAYVNIHQHACRRNRFYLKLSK